MLRAVMASPDRLGITRGCLLMISLLCWNARGQSQMTSVPVETRSTLLSIDRSMSPKAGFRLMDPMKTGVVFTNLLATERHMTNQMLLNGSGVCAGDVDRDGLVDLYFTSLDGPNRLYRNRGQWRFEDITLAAGLDCPESDSTACAFADLDGDADLDLLVHTMYRGLRVFQNNGELNFTEKTQTAGMVAAKGGMSLAVADYDLDGDLDIYVTRYRSEAMMDEVQATVRIKTVGSERSVSHFNNRPTTDPDLRNRFYIDQRGGIGEYGEVDTLYRNLGGFAFEAVDWTDGTFLDDQAQPLSTPPRDWGLAVQFHDLNHDGWPDLYVCNDFDTPDRIWINTGKGSFQAMAPQTLRQTSWFSMGMDVADVNRDGEDDILVLDMLARDHATRMNQLGDVKPVLELIQRPSFVPQYMKTTLQMNRGNLSFAEVGQWAGVSASDWAWGVCFLDVDLDGFEDVLISNGHERNGRDIDVSNQLKAFRKSGDRSKQEILQKRMEFPRYATANIALRNRGDGSFEDVSKPWGFDVEGVSHGMCLADLDQDGDLDVIINNLNTSAFVFQNQSQAPRYNFRIVSNRSVPSGIGTRITLLHESGQQSKQIKGGGRYLSGDDPMLAFAAIQGSQSPTRAEITWPGGSISVIENLQADHLYTLQAPETAHQSSDIEPVKPTPLLEALFENDSDLLPHLHEDPAFNDWARQPLIPRSLANEGPAVAWLDLNEDGWEDLVLSGGRGTRLGIFLNQSGQALERYQKAPYQLPVSRDQVSLVGWKEVGQPAWVLSGSSNYEDGLPLGSPVREYGIDQPRPLDRFGPQPHTTGPMALGDVDGDGTLELFVGAKILPGQYPLAGSSTIYRRDQGRWVANKSLSEPLQDLGMIRAALWLDVDQDGFPELILSREWDSPLLFKNQQGRLVDQTQIMGLADAKGCWSGLASGDFDEDGRIDWIAGNWGLNGPHAEHLHHPLVLYHGLLNQDPVRDVLQAHWEPSMEVMVPNEQLGTLSRGIPELITLFPSYRDFGELSIQSVIEKWKTAMEVKTVSDARTTLFLNKGTHFEKSPLPVEAQWAPVFGVVSGDFNGDGHLDVFLAQNDFHGHPQAPRMDAGLGLLCLGDGAGQWKVLSPSESGLRILGEQRGAATADWNQDGRLDLVVGQNNGQTMLLTNRQAAQGHRIRFKGSSSDEWGIGVQWRLVGDSGRTGPWQAIHAGSSYGSQNGSLQVAPRLPGMNRLEVLWPGGARSQHSLEGLQSTQRIQQP